MCFFQIESGQVDVAGGCVGFFHGAEAIGVGIGLVGNDCPSASQGERRPPVHAFQMRDGAGALPFPAVEACGEDVPRSGTGLTIGDPQASHGVKGRVGCFALSGERALFRAPVGGDEAW